MTWRDNLEIGLKKDAEFRKDNLPEEQVRGPEVPAGPGRSPVVPAAKADAVRASIEHEQARKLDPKADEVKEREEVNRVDDDSKPDSSPKE